MNTFYFKGGETKDPNNYEPNGIPVGGEDGDLVIFDQSTEDVCADITFTCSKLKMTDFKNDIYYAICSAGGSVRNCGILRNEDRYDVFVNRPDIERVD